jgi:DNA polymerase iota
MRRLSTEKGPKWNLQLINICVANMVLGATEDKPGVGRNIANMFKHQDEALRPWRVIQHESEKDDKNDGDSSTLPQETNDTTASDSEGGWEENDNHSCPQCGHSIPAFALAAHLRYHEFEE